MYKKCCIFIESERSLLQCQNFTIENSIKLIETDFTFIHHLSKTHFDISFPPVGRSLSNPAPSGYLTKYLCAFLITAIVVVVVQMSGIRFLYL